MVDNYIDIFFLFKKNTFLKIGAAACKKKPFLKIGAAAKTFIKIGQLVIFQVKIKKKFLKIGAAAGMQGKTIT